MHTSRNMHMCITYTLRGASSTWITCNAWRGLLYIALHKYVTTNCSCERRAYTVTITDSTAKRSITCRFDVGNPPYRTTGTIHHSVHKTCTRIDACILQQRPHVTMVTRGVGGGGGGRGDTFSKINSNIGPGPATPGPGCFILVGLAMSLSL